MTTVEPVTDQPEQMVTMPAARESPTDGISMWGSGLCACCNDIGSCCLGFFCIPVLACIVSGKMGECCCVGCVTLPALRTKYRVEQGIQGSVCKDCLASSACFPCVLCQLKRELSK